MGIRICDIRYPDQFTISYGDDIMIFTFQQQFNTVIVSLCLKPGTKTGKISKYLCHYNNIESSFFKLKGDNISLFIFSTSTLDRLKIKDFLSILYDRVI